MNPALYYPWVYLRGGAERIVLELMLRSRHHWTLYTNRYEPDSTFPAFKDLDVVRLRQVSVRRSLKDVARAGATLLTQRLELKQHGSLLVVCEGLGTLVAARSRVPASCLCLTPLKIAYDDATRQRFFRSPGRRIHYRMAVGLYKRLERPAWRRYRRVLCISEEVRRRVRRTGIPDDRLEVTYPGVDTTRFRPTGEREPIFYVPGRIMWTKNLELAIEAWLRFKPDPATNPFRLVVAGIVDQKSRPYADQLHALARGRPDIIIKESDDELLRLYQRSHAVIFTPPNEDWGLVPLEAMACGKPVLATNRGGPRESVIDGQTGFLRLDHPSAFASAIRALAEMSPENLEIMGSCARRRALEFTWDRFVERIDEHVDELHDGRAHGGLVTAGRGQGGLAG